MPKKNQEQLFSLNYEKARAVPNLDKELHQIGVWNNRLHPVLEYGIRPREFLPSLQKQIWGQWKLRNRFREDGARCRVRSLGQWEWGKKVDGAAEAFNVFLTRTNRKEPLTHHTVLQNSNHLFFSIPFFNSNIQFCIKQDSIIWFDAMLKKQGFDQGSLIVRCCAISPPQC